MPRQQEQRCQAAPFAGAPGPRCSSASSPPTLRPHHLAPLPQRHPPPAPGARRAVKRRARAPSAWRARASTPRRGCAWRTPRSRRSRRASWSTLGWTRARRGAAAPRRGARRQSGERGVRGGAGRQQAGTALAGQLAAAGGWLSMAGLPAKLEALPRAVPAQANHTRVVSHPPPWRRFAQYGRRNSPSYDGPRRCVRWGAPSPAAASASGSFLTWLMWSVQAPPAHRRPLAVAAGRVSLCGPRPCPAAHTTPCFAPSPAERAQTRARGRRAAGAPPWPACPSSTRARCSLACALAHSSRSLNQWVPHA